MVDEGRKKEKKSLTHKKGSFHAVLLMLAYKISLKGIIIFPLSPLYASGKAENFRAIHDEDGERSFHYAIQFFFNNNFCHIESVAMIWLSQLLKLINEFSLPKDKNQSIVGWNEENIHWNDGKRYFSLPFSIS